MACGAPVIAFRAGAVPEVVDDGVTGFVVRTLDEAVEALSRLDTLDRRKVRSMFEQRFAAERMAKDYLKIYADLPLVKAEAARLPRSHGETVDQPAVA